eukprot:TRINITY_DN18996_c0_g2_i5.p1 TRINITY_DN18996_c0_g2~~TRINITY_DN18996_c0_g2_i5.p1  ORF type:complete len:159 (+),score=0.05 TRINITY_DN18996_c0_g2_i5:375-851(+)
MDDHRLPFKAYKSLLLLDERGKTNWITRVRNMLCTNGLAYVWVNRGVGCVQSFIKTFRQRLVDIRWQHWEDHINTSERFSFYRQFKTLPVVESYIMLDMNRHVRYAMTKFRLGVSDIAVHSSRFSYDRDKLICPLCKEKVEDEIHFAFCCPNLHNLRK